MNQTNLTHFIVKLIKQTSQAKYKFMKENYNHATNLIFQ